MSLARAPVPRTPLSPTARIMVGLSLGVATGLFFGESVTVLEPVAKIYLRLMQMPVLPYLVPTLIVGFGQLKPHRAVQVAARAGALLVLTWLLTITVISALTLSFPKMEGASFFSSSIIEPSDFSVVDLYFTANPFGSLANAIVPAVVLFSSLFGVGLMTHPKRELVLGVLQVASEAVIGVNRILARLTPIGVFAIVAISAGTVTSDTVSRLEVYLVCFAAAGALLTFWLLPLVVSSTTPFRYREVLGIASEALLTAFVAESVFLVLPLLQERTKALIERHGLSRHETDAGPEVLVPILYNFPLAGKLLTLLFVPFAGWLAGSRLSTGDFAALFGLGISIYFGSTQSALPFLLDRFSLPQDLFQLYSPTTVITGKVASMVSAMNLLVVALLGSAVAVGAFTLERRRLLRGAAMGAAAVIGVVALVSVILSATVDTRYHPPLPEMRVDRDIDSAIVHRMPASVPVAPAPPGRAFEQIVASGRLRVGYDPENLPFSFFNAHGQLVGYDIELALGLAEAMGVQAEFCPVTWAEVPARLADGTIDVMPGVWYRPFWFRSLRLSQPYLTQTVGFAVLDHRRDEFASVAALRQSRGLKIGISLDVRQNSPSAARYFGGSDAELTVTSPKEFFEGRAPKLDAFLLPVEAGAAATLRYPQYTVVVPQPEPVKLPVAFGVRLGEEALAMQVDEWVTFAMSEGLLHRAHTQWIEGQGAHPHPRWSILKDVLSR